MSEQMDAADFIAANTERFNAFGIATLELAQERKEPLLVAGTGALACALSCYRSAVIQGQLAKEEAFSLFLFLMTNIAVDLEFLNEADATALLGLLEEKP